MQTGGFADQRRMVSAIVSELGAVLTHQSRCENAKDGPVFVCRRPAIFEELKQDESLFKARRLLTIQD
jgi:hypothetical protein